MKYFIFISCCLFLIGCEEKRSNKENNTPSVEIYKYVVIGKSQHNSEGQVWATYRPDSYPNSSLIFTSYREGPFIVDSDKYKEFKMGDPVEIDGEQIKDIQTKDITNEKLEH